jgi:hypothetical protein
MGMVCAMGRGSRRRSDGVKAGIVWGQGLVRGACGLADTLVYC